MSFPKDRKQIRRERAMDLSKTPDQNADTPSQEAAMKAISALPHEEIAQYVANAYLEMVKRVKAGEIDPNVVLEVSALGLGKIVHTVTQAQGLKIENRRAVRKRSRELAIVSDTVRWLESPLAFQDTVSTGWHHQQHDKLVERDKP